jgi:hypothetical protein
MMDASLVTLELDRLAFQACTSLLEHNGTFHHVDQPRENTTGSCPIVSIGITSTVAA